MQIDPSFTDVDYHYRDCRAYWFPYNQSKPRQIFVGAVVYEVGDGIIVPHVSLLNMLGQVIFRNEIVVPRTDAVDGAGYNAFVVYSCDHGKDNASLRSLKSPIRHAGEFVVFRVAQGKD